MTSSLENSGLSKNDISLMQKVLQSFPEIKQCLLFGSRAKGTHKKGSDIDLAVKGKEVSYETTIRFSRFLNEELPLPYFFDVVHYESIQNPDLIDHIDRVGVILHQN